jgi:hypothetical protein
MATDINLSSLMTSLSCWEIAEYVAVGAVIVGVVGEFLHDFGSSLKRRFSWWNSWGGKISGSVLIVALAVELITLVKTNSISGQVIAFIGDQAAETRERAAILEKDAELARLEQERLKALVTWREITPEQREILISHLESQGGEVTIGYAQNDPEAFAFGALISHVFGLINEKHSKIIWNVSPNPLPRIYNNIMYFDLFISDPENATTKVLREAFSAAHIEFRTTDVRKGENIRIGAMTLAQLEPTTDGFIMVASKTPPFWPKR